MANRTFRIVWAGRGLTEDFIRLEQVRYSQTHEIFLTRMQAETLMNTIRLKLDDKPGVAFLCVCRYRIEDEPNVCGRCGGYIMALVDNTIQKFVESNYTAIKSVLRQDDKLLL